MAASTRWVEGRVSLRHPIAYLLVAFSLGPLYAWTIVSAARILPWTRRFAIDMFAGNWREHAIPFALACAGLAWGLRRRIATATGGGTLWLAFWCSMLGGPLCSFFLEIESFVRVPGQLGGNIAQTLQSLIQGLLASVLLGGPFGTLFLPLSLPLSWAAILLLRATSRGTRGNFVTA